MFKVTFVAFADRLCEQFTNDVYQKAEKEDDITCKYFRYDGSEDSYCCEEIFINDSHYTIVFVPATSEKKFIFLLQKLSDFLKYWPLWNKRVKFIFLWNVPITVDLHPDQCLNLEIGKERNEFYDIIKDMWVSYKKKCDMKEREILSNKLSPQSFVRSILNKDDFGEKTEKNHSEASDNTNWISRIPASFKNIKEKFMESTRHPNPPGNPVYDQKRSKPLNDEMIPSGPCGLRNRMEICYMNSMIQALSASKTFIKQLTQIQLDGSNNKLDIFIHILNGINNNKDIVQITEDLARFMKMVDWNRPSQQDAFQLLSFFINAIEKDIKTGVKMPPKLVLLHTFSENKQYNKTQDHLGLALPLCGSFTEYPGEPLELLLAAFFEPSTIDDGFNKTQMYLFDKAPEVLILHIQGNEWNNDIGQYCKLDYHIKYEEFLNYTFEIQKEKDWSDPKKENVRYQLVAVVHHSGEISLEIQHLIVEKLKSGLPKNEVDHQLSYVTITCKRIKLFSDLLIFLTQLCAI